MKVNITGSSGFVGQNLVNYFRNENSDITELSLRNPDWLKGLDMKADVIIHLAGKAHDTSNVSNPEEYFKINRDLTIQLFQAFLKSDIRDFFYFSSVKAVTDSIDVALEENYTCDPKTAYGKSKLEAELFLLKQVLPKEKRLFIIRPCMIHGPGNKGNLNLLYAVVKKGIPWPLAAFDNKRSFLSIDNLSYLLYAMIQKTDLPSGIYNFADDEVLSTNDLVKLISETLGRKAKLWAIPSSLIKYMVKIGDIIPLPLNSERLKKLTESYVVSNKKIRGALGIEHLPLTAKDGLQKSIRSFQ